MPKSRACDYCGDDIEPGTGTMLVRTNGSTVYYCSAKCEKNADLGREARDLEWTAAGQEAGGETLEEPAEDEVDPETVEEVDEREEAGSTPDLEEAETEATDDSADDEEAATDAPDDSDAEDDDETSADADEDEADEEADEEAEEAQA